MKPKLCLQNQMRPTEGLMLGSEAKGTSNLKKMLSMVMDVYESLPCAEI